ncbi:nitrous oxide reductase family maturation protein NosD [Bacillus sp. REN3]|uniref:right-handed parallel beta-helix repeat-containing protein n=1 Tax=Bacillus sp. REN3 TaxID=2802440 RepID=UPI001AEEDD48|nr:nitrous oxide reductase family maturation protein NosD [Bacillus sp. REN3]
MSRFDIPSACFSRLLAGFFFSFALLFFCGQTPVQGEEIKVRNGESIQKAIDQSQPGDVLEIAPGVYRERLEITKAIAIKGKDGAIIDGAAKGSVITITGSGVLVEGLAVQNSGVQQEDSGIYVKKGNGNVIKQNTFKNVHNGIYIANSKDNQVLENTISSYESHFSKRGNGIHLFKGGKHLIKGNEISEVQDGIYYDFTSQIHAAENHIFNSRYAMHFMFSGDVKADRNMIEKNITGFMVMDSEKIDFTANVVSDHFHFRGFGIIIYESKDILIERNEILRNSTGLSLEHGGNTLTRRNMIAANQVGLEFRGENKDNIFSENNFIGNVVQSKISGTDMRLDDGRKGNYWDDYSSFDLSGDGIGEEAYKAGSLYDRLLQKQPYWQFFFESPSVKLWTKAESLFPTFGTVDIYDARPLTEPVPMMAKQDRRRSEGPPIPLMAGMLFMIVSLFVIVKGRKLL